MDICQLPSLAYYVDVKSMDEAPVTTNECCTQYSPNAWTGGYNILGPSLPRGVEYLLARMPKYRDESARAS